MRSLLVIALVLLGILGVRSECLNTTVTGELSEELRQLQAIQQKFVATQGSLEAAHVSNCNLANQNRNLQRNVTVCQHLLNVTNSENAALNTTVTTLSNKLQVAAENITVQQAQIRTLTLNNNGLAGQLSALTSVATPGVMIFESRKYTGAMITSAEQAIQQFNVATQPTGYCTKFISALTDINNRGVCSNTNEKNIAYKISAVFAVKDAEAGSWTFRAGVDFGLGGVMLIDGQVVDQKFRDLWWAGNYGSDGVLSASVNLKAGVHTLVLIGFEGCCDGTMSVQVKKANSNSFEDVTSSLVRGDDCKVTFYAEDFSGSSVTLTGFTGEYSYADLQARGFNDVITSVVVEGNCKVTIFEHDFSGKSLTLTRGRHPKDFIKTQNLNDQVSSVRVEAAPFVYPPVYSDFKLLVDVDFYGSDYLDFDSTLDDCVTACRNDADNCFSAEFNEARNHCWLKNKIPALTDNNDGIAISRVPTPDATGSFSRTCTGCKSESGVLSCDSCRRINQTQNKAVTPFQYTTCEKMAVKNDNGALTCEKKN